MSPLACGWPYSRLWMTYVTAIGPCAHAFWSCHMCFRTYHEMQGQAFHNCSALDCGHGYHQKGRKEDLQLSEQIECIHSTLVSMGEKLKTFHLTDGRLAKLDDNSFVYDISTKQEMQEFKLLAQKLIGCRLQVYDPWKLRSSGSLHLPFSTPSERDSITFDSLKVVCQYLGLSVPQRRSARKIISPQIIQYDMLREALEEIARNLDTDLRAIDKPSNKVFAAKEASARCIQLLCEGSPTIGSPSWAKLASYKNFHSPKSKWGDVLESFEVILDVLKDVESLKLYVTTIEGMKEGLGHIKDIQLDNNLHFKKIHHRKSYVEHELVYNLGYTSKCLFTLLVFYLFQSIRSITVDMAGGLYRATEENSYICMGEIITSADRKMLWIAVKHLDKALGLIRFISEIIGTKNSHRRILAGVLVQAVYVLERDRQEKRQGPQDALAPAWWTFFKYHPIEIMVDKVDGSIFGAVFERTKNEKPQANIPRSIVAFRGSILKPDTLRTDLKLDLILITNGLHKTPRFDFALGAVRSAIAKHGHSKVWVAGHSLGAAFAMLAARKLCEDEGLVLESHLFNPPFASAPLERIKNEKLKFGMHVAHSFVTAGLAVAVKGKTRGASERDAFSSLGNWVPNLYVNPADDISSGYVGYFGNRERMQEMGVGRIHNIAARHSINESIMAAFGKESKASHLIPSARMTLNLGPSPDFKRAHGIHQWWSPDLQIRCTSFRFPASET